MQDSLTLLFELTFATGGGYVLVGFVLGLADFWQRCSPDYQPALTPLKVAEQVPLKALPAASEEKVVLEPIPLGELKQPELEMTQTLVDEVEGV